MFEARYPHAAFSQVRVVPQVFASRPRLFTPGTFPFLIIFLFHLS